ncbi:lamin tail domain-containing protein, partial [Roseofilum casamattae]
PWQHIPNSGAVLGITTMSDGTLVGIGMGNQLWTRETLTSPWQHIPNSGAVLGITTMSDGTLVGIGMGNQLWTRETLTSPWQHIPNSGSVIGIVSYPAKPKVVITTISYKGEVKRTQSDEYIEIANQGNGAADISGWKVTSNGKNQEFVFPAGTSLAGGKSFRVYTNEVHEESGGFSFGSKTAIWNDKGDTGKLFDAEGNEVSSYSYEG